MEIECGFQVLTQLITYQHLHLHVSSFVDNIKAIYDASFVGDQCMRENFDTFHSLVRQSKRRDKEKPTAPPYLHEFYNVQGFYPKISDVKSNATGRIVNATIDALNQEDRLPRFLVIAIDKDVINDLKSITPNRNDKQEEEMESNMALITNWITRQVDIAVRRKKSKLKQRNPELLEAKQTPQSYILI